MPTDLALYQLLFRDGTSQARRMLPALDPAYVSVDERSIRDLLAFARAYAEELSYFNDHNTANGDWTTFFDGVEGDKGNLDEMVAFLENPDQFRDDPEKKAWYARPHLVLLLAFLQLLQHARTQLNDFTRRHLEFYYNEVLKLTLKQAVPDRVHVLVALARGQSQFRLPAGTLLKAGADSQGADLFYKTDHDLVVNRATVASRKSLFVEKQVIGLDEVRKAPEILRKLYPDPSRDDLWDDLTTPEQAFMAMLELALGDPENSYLSARYPGNKPLDKTLLGQLDVLLGFIQSELYMAIPVFRSLMQQKRSQDAAVAKWTQINDILEAAGQQRDNGFVLDRSEPRHFEKNLMAALGLQTQDELDHYFDTLPEVSTIYDLHRLYLRFRVREADDPERQTVENFIRAQLFMEPDDDPQNLDFGTMMGVVDDIYQDWRRIYNTLQIAGRRKRKADPNHTLDTTDLRAYDPNLFGTLVEKTLGTIDYTAVGSLGLNSLDACYDEVQHLEGYFAMSAEDFASVRAIDAKALEARSWEWEQVYTILRRAHKKKLLAQTHNVLKAKREEEVNNGAGPYDAFETTLRFALDYPEDGTGLPGEEPQEGEAARTITDLDPTNDKDADYIRQKLYMDVASFLQVKATVEAAMANEANENDWTKIYDILAQAHRKKRGLGDSGTQIEKWENVYVADDATQVAVQVGLGDEEETPRWRTFGEGHRADLEARTVPATLGLAVASPLLALAEGKRTITITLGFKEENFDLGVIDATIPPRFKPDHQGAPTGTETIPFRFFLSTAEEMVEVLAETQPDDGQTPPQQHVMIGCGAFDVVVKGEQKTYAQALRISLKLDEQAAAVAPLTAGEGLETAWPVLQILLRDDEDEGRLVKQYLPFQKLRLEHVHLHVAVVGMTALTLQNDAAVLNAKKPFEPFGTAPATGSSFYMAHPELCAKGLDALTMTINWMGVPDDLKTHYAAYTNAGIADNTSFKAQLKFYDNRGLFPVKINQSDVQLFHAEGHANETGASREHTISISRADLITSYSNYKQNLHLIAGEEVLDWSRYWLLELLSPDFQHATYPQAITQYAAKLAKDTAADPPTNTAGDPPNPPYTPKINRLKVDYAASTEIDPAARDAADRLYHVEAFGYRAVTEDGGYAFLPQYESQGELYVGIDALVPPQNLALLFQMAEGSADPDLERTPVRWDYLDGNVWRSLEEGRLRSDTTNGLLNSGIVKLDLPPVAASTVLPPALYWIRATIDKNTRSVCDTVAILTQAVSATFEDRGNAPDHLDQPLPADSITGLAAPQPQVKAIRQPYSSTGGAGPEQATRFYTRVSERLRHKNRALTCWDYERLILEAFPGIYKVKCLPVDASDNPQLAGSIQVIVVPDIRGKRPFDPFEPKVPADTLLKIERLLHVHTPALARFTVKNPRYVQLKVRFAVRFREGYNPGYYLQVLNNELRAYLAPWAYDQSAEIVFGGRINANLIVNFVEERYYVDYLAGIRLFTIHEGKVAEVQPDQPVIAEAPDVILVSARQHEIDELTEEGFVEEAFVGINYMKVALDFRVA